MLGILCIESHNVYVYLDYHTEREVLDYLKYDFKLGLLAPVGQPNHAWTDSKERMTCHMDMPYSSPKLLTMVLKSQKKIQKCPLTFKLSFDK